MNMIVKCPNENCKFNNIVKDGHYDRKNDSQKIQRFRCLSCKKRFSKSTLTLEYKQKKRRINSLLFKLLASGNSQRRCAYLLNVNKKTIERRLIYLGEKSRKTQNQIITKNLKGHIEHVQFDDLITIEHTKLKPLSVTTVVEKGTRLILAAEVSQIPAFGKIAKISQAKYGFRKSTHAKALTNVFKSLVNVIAPNATFESDEHKLYPKSLRRHFPNAIHKRYKGGRGCITGQGELKQKKYDPLFSINHTYAMFRANINRLFRKSWCTTKNPQRLKDHLDIYICFHNQRILGLI